MVVFCMLHKRYYVHIVLCACCLCGTMYIYFCVNVVCVMSCTYSVVCMLYMWGCVHMLRCACCTCGATSMWCYAHFVYAVLHVCGVVYVL